MNINPLKRLASHLPVLWQQELKRLHYRFQIYRQTFQTTEPEFFIVDQLIEAGDWVIDVGANVGHYTKRFSDLVASQGRVIAIEPVPYTFALLAANVSLFKYSNVTLLNLAASNRTAVVGIEIPDFESGLKNYYEAMVTDQLPDDHQVLSVALDSLVLDHRIRLIKIDAEGHDPLVLDGMERILARDHPTLIIETNSPNTTVKLASLGYESEKLPDSPNMLFRWFPKAQ